MDKQQREAEKILKQFRQMIQVRPELLNNETRMLFDGIMKIADERDKYKKQNKISAKEHEKAFEILDRMIELLIKDLQFKGAFKDMTEEEIYRHYEAIVMEDTNER